jgi:hypothetical protein
LHKKALVDAVSKKRTRKNTKVQRAIVGINLEEVKSLKGSTKSELSQTHNA